MGYASIDGTLTEEMIDERVNDAVRQHKIKMGWLGNEKRPIATAFNVSSTETAL